jgi:UDP-N-acetyl-D-mannosaminuronate dehydrogenase
LRNRKTLVVGIGEVGGALAHILDQTEPGGVLRQDLEPCDFHDLIGVMHICIPYQSRQQFETAALEYITRFKPELSIINSTVVPGTTRRLARQSSQPLAYSPVRGKHARMIEDMLRYRKFVAADDPNSAAAAEQHFNSAGMRTCRVAKPETLELAKLAETTYFGVQIAFAQELNRFARTVEAEYSETIDFFEEVEFLPRARYYPGFIGGHCVIPNIQLLKQVVDSPLLEAVLNSNQRRADELVAENNPAACTQEQGRSGHESKVPAPR